MNYQSRSPGNGRNSGALDKAAKNAKIRYYARGDVLVSTGVWNEDKRAVAVIHVKSTR